MRRAVKTAVQGKRRHAGRVVFHHSKNEEGAKMKSAACCIAMIMLMCLCFPVQAKDTEAYIEEARKFNEAGKSAEAIASIFS